MNLVSKSTIFITGGAGFIGSAMVRDLVKNTDHMVINIDSITYSGNLASLASIEGYDNYKFYKTNIGDTEKIKKLLKKYLPDLIINFAAETHVDKSIDNPGIFFQTNVQETLCLISVVKDYFNEIDKEFLFHHISTDEVYGDIPLDSEPSNEKTPYNPSSPYSASKASSDHIMRAFYRTFKLPITISNCSNNFGPFQYPEKLIPHMIIKIKQSQKLPIYGDGCQIRDWLSVYDHIDGIMKIIYDGKIGATYNIGGASSEVQNIQIVRKICDLMDDFGIKHPDNIKSTDLIEFVHDRPGHDKRYAIDSSRIKNELNWTAKIDINQGLKDTVRWYLDNENWWQEILKTKSALNRQGNLR